MSQDYRQFPASFNLFIEYKFFKHIFTEPKIANCKDPTINHSNIYLIFDLIGRQESIS